MATKVWPLPASAMNAIPVTPLLFWAVSWTVFAVAELRPDGIVTPEGSTKPDGRAPDGNDGTLAEIAGRLTDGLGPRVGRFNEGAGEAPPPHAAITRPMAVTRPKPPNNRRRCMQLPPAHGGMVFHAKWVSITPVPRTQQRAPTRRSRLQCPLNRRPACGRRGQAGCQAVTTPAACSRRSSWSSVALAPRRS